jgi:very-short-patch-repair endonuclease
MEINESYVIEQYTKNRSANDIAKELGTYPNKISRIIKKNGYEVRGRSEAQKAALESGVSTHPTRGRRRTEQEKENISSSRSKAWKKMSKKEKEAFSDGAKERWNQMPASQKLELQQAAGRALRIASIEGSKAEQSLRNNLMKEGHDVILHKKDLIPGEYEIDLFLPNIKTVIEIDGPQHFLPVWGEQKLMDTIKYDEIKNGLLMSNGYRVIRVKYLCKHLSMAVERLLCDKVREVLDNITEDSVDRTNRLIEIEINMETNE